MDHWCHELNDAANSSVKLKHDARFPFPLQSWLGLQTHVRPQGRNIGFHVLDVECAEY